MLSNSIAQKSKTKHFADTVWVEKTSVIIHVQTKPFVEKNHTVEYETSDDRDNKWVKLIDGLHVYGTDGTLPRIEIDTMWVKWGDSITTIPKSLYRDCYEPHFTVNEDESTYGWYTVVSEDNRSIMIHMSASDGAGSYSVYWIVSLEGNHQRFIQHEC